MDKGTLTLVSTRTGRTGWCDLTFVYKHPQELTVERSCQAARSDGGNDMSEKSGFVEVSHNWENSQKWEFPKVGIDSQKWEFSIMGIGSSGA